MIVGGDWDEMSELLRGKEIFQKDALVHLMVEGDFIESLLEVPSEQFVVNERLLGQEMQVLLEWLSDEVLTQWLEETLLRSLALHEREHSP